MYEKQIPTYRIYRIYKLAPIFYFTLLFAIPDTFNTETLDYIVINYNKYVINTNLLKKTI